jgi:V/A-type H+-transporting ATPase subunit E
MSTTDIVNKIIEDAEAEKAQALSEAQKKADELLREAEQSATKAEAESKAQAQKKCADIAERKAASARLECAKITLAERHRVLDGVYEKALKKLIDLSKVDCLALTGRLLESYAEEGDTIWFAKNFLYAEDAAKLQVVGKKHLKVAKERLNLSGGFVLKGELSDKDLSYDKLLAADKEENAGQVLSALYK